MAYDVFIWRVNALVSKVGGLSVDFSREDGLHIARVSDGTVITGNAISGRISVQWGSGHSATAVI